MTDLSAMSDDELKALYAKPAAAPVKAPAEMTDDELKAAYGGGGVTAKDVGRVAGVAAQASAKSTFGGFGDLADLVGNGSEYLLNKGIRAVGGNIPERTYGQIAEENKRLSEGSRILPRGEDIQRGLDKAGVGLKPENRAERYAETIGSFATPAPFAGGGSNIIKGGKFVALPGAASEFAGEKTAGTAAEPYARIAAAVAAPFAPGVGKRMVTPFPASPRQTEMVGRLEDAGVTSLTAGQRTGSPTLQALESKVGNSPGTGYAADRISGEGDKQFTQAVMDKTGSPGMATKPELQSARDRVGGDFNRLSANNTLKPDTQMMTDLRDTATRYGNVLDANQKPIFDKLLDNIYDKALSGGMSGHEYQIARSQLGGKARGLQVSDPEAAKAFKGLQKSLDEAMERGLSPADKKAWRTARDEYGRLKDIEGAVPKSGGALVEGVIDPAALNRSISTGKDASAAARGQLPFSDLAEAGAGVMKKPERIPLSQPTLSGVAMGVPNALMGRALMSGPGQSYLGNQRMSGQRAGSPTVAAIANALMAAQQGRR